MSRIGRMQIAVPSGVTVDIAAGNVVTVKGPKGTLTQKLHPDMLIELDGGFIHVKRPSEDKEHKALHGLTRSLINNMVVGVTEGYKKELEINGVGYRAAKQGNQLVLNIGYSHQVVFTEPAGITFDVPNPNAVVVSGADKQQVGKIASEIREKRPPEPYLGKGIKYADERIKRKSGKAGK